MRRTILFGICIFVTTAGFSQVIQKGDKLLGGTLGGNFNNYTQNNTNNRGSNAGVYPSLSFAIKNNLALGIRGGIAYSHQQYTQGVGETVQSSFSTGVGLFLKKYRPVHDKFGFYFDHSVHGSFFSNKSKDPTNFTNIQKGWGAGYLLTPGVFYRFTERFLGEGSLGGLYANYSAAANGGTENFSAGASFLQYFNVGINYRFGRKPVSAGQ